MKRTNIYLTNSQHERLKKIAEREDMRFSELVRRAVEAYLRRGEETRYYEDVDRRE